MESTVQIHIFDVMPTQTGMWALVADGVPVTINCKRSDALEAGRAFALKNRPSRLIIRAANGQIESITPFAIEFR